MKNVLSVLLAVLLSYCAHAQSKPKEHAAQQTARHFYAWVLANNGMGLPSPEAIRPLAPLLAPELIQLLESTHRLEARCIQTTPPDLKPPVFEGSLFVGNYEGANEVIIDPPKINGKYATLTARLVLIDERMPKAHPYRAFTWVDELHLVNNHGQWLIRDIRFNRQDSLIKTLKDYINENQPCKK